MSCSERDLNWNIRHGWANKPDKNQSVASVLLEFRGVRFTCTALRNWPPLHWHRCPFARFDGGNLILVILSHCSTLFSRHLCSAVSLNAKCHFNLHWANARNKQLTINRQFVNEFLFFHAFHFICKLTWIKFTEIKSKLGLLDYDKNHNHEYFGQYCNQDYLTIMRGPYRT